MYYFKSLRLALIVLAVSCLFAGCSNSDQFSPIDPGMPLSDSITGGCRDAVAVYDAVIDPLAQTFAITYNERSMAGHFPLTQVYPTVLRVTGFGFTPNFWADIQLVHPMPGSGIDAFDPRVIAIFPANPGVCFNYPVLDVTANNAILLEPDGYTRLFDDLGGSIPGNANPFKAYFKDEPYRQWASSGVYQETQNWDMNIDGFGGPMTFKLVVDVSTNYPGSPTPLTDNAPEPVAMSIDVTSDLTPLGGEAVIDVVVHDWQDVSGIGGVLIEAPDLFNGTNELQYVDSPDLYEYQFSGSISNEMGVAGGDYNALIASWDVLTGIYLYDEITLSVVSFNPSIIKTVTLPAFAHSVAVKDGYAFVAQYRNGQNYGVKVIDVDPPEEAIIKATGSSSTYGTDIYIQGDFAYIANGSDGIIKYDINPPESIESICTHYPEPRGSMTGVHAVDQFIFASNAETGLHILDSSYPTHMYILKVLPTPGESRDIYVSGGYAYIADGEPGLQIVDIAPRESAHIVNTIDTPGYAEDVFVADGFAYVADNDSGLIIIDVDPIASAHIVGEVDTFSAVKVKVVGKYAFVADFTGGMRIIDVYPPEEAFIVATIETTSETCDVYVDGKYAYIADWENGLQIVELW